MKKTYIPSTPRSRKLKSVGGGTINVSGGSAQNAPVIEGHTHDNKIILDAITQLHLRILSSLNVDDDGALIVELSNIIKELDATVPTDENLFSALRTVLEIRARSISKTDPDTAQEIITFLKGIIASGTSKFDNIEVGNYTTGALGAGAAIKMDNGVSRMEVDQLDVRMRATFRELIIESLKHIGGQLILSPARMKCTSVVDGGTYYKCYFDTGDGKVSNEFVAGDQARCQVFTGSGVKMYWRLVTSVGTDWINLSKTDAISGSSIPEAGDDIVQLGNRSDVTRQNAQILSTVGADAPSWKQYKGINSFSLEGKDTTVFSGTGNKIDGKTVFTSNGANVEDGINSKNSNYSSQPTSYKANDTWTLSADTTVNGIAYKSGEILTATQDSTTYNQAHWVKKVRYTDDTAVENLQIGGVNLINGDTKLIERTAVGWTHIPLSRQLVEGKTYILGGEFRIDTGTSGVIGLNNADSNIGLVVPPRNIPFVATAYMASRTHFALAKQVGTSPDLVVSAKEVKLEEGNKKTAWAQSPEYVQAKIDAAKQEALTAAGNAQTSANNANTAVGDLNAYVDGSFKDGVIEASEAKAIEKYINIVNTEKSNLEAIYNTLYANTYLEGTPKTNLLNAKVTYFGAVDTLLNSINTAISDGKTTIAEKQAVDTNYTSYKTALASLQTAIENANKAIQAKLDALSTEKVNNLQIGGRNLFILKDYNPVVSSSLGNTYLITVASIIGSEYTLSTNIPLVDVNTYDAWFDNDGVMPSSSVNGVGINKPRTIVATGSLLNIMVRNQTIVNKIKSGEYWFKLEKGNKATDWTESPEDVQERIDAVKLTAEQAQLAADGYIRARYVRDWISGSTSNNNNIWGEIKVINKAGTNIAIGKIPSANGTFETANPATYATDNNATTYAMIANVSNVANYVQIDLGAINYDIDYIQVWHYPERTFYGTKTEISTDGVNWTPVFDSAKSGTYKETAAGNIISLRPHEVLAKTLKSQAITDKFGTTIDGGLIGAVTMLLRELNSTDETAGISGIRGANRNLPAFWTGTYADAIAGTAGIIFRHNSTGKIGVLDVDANGNVKLLDSIDPSIVRLLFSKSAIPSIESIRSGSDSGSVQNASVLRNTTLTSILPETATITNNGVHMSISGSLRISAGLAAGYNYGEAYVGLSLYKNDVFYSIVSQYDMILESASLTTETTPFNVSLVVPAGTYSLVLETSFLNASSGSQAGTNTATTMTWVFEESIRRFEWGTNGFMNYRPNGHIHHTEEKGLDVRGATNTPGVLLSGSVAIGGGFVNSWGAKKHATLTAQKTATGTYTVYHSAGHTGYSVQITPETDQRVYYVPTANKGTSSFIVYFRNLAGTLSDSNFSFSIMGDNYIT